ncbi:MAG: response regulator [Lentisphaeria bacterium]|nr:response regulator [Lentisphaeria bacterium]
MQNYFYSSVAGIALLVHVIINWQQLFQRKSLKSRPGAVEFRHFLLSLLLFFACDVLWGILAELKWRYLLHVDTILFFLMMALSIFAWTHYVVTYLQMSGRPLKCLLWMGRGLLTFFIAALFVNSFTGCFFRFNALCMYSAGPVRQLALLLLAAFNITSSSLTLRKLLHTEGTVRRRNRVVFAFGLTMLTAILLQLGDPLLPVYSVGCLLGVCLLHVFVIEDERDEMHQKELLAHDYAAQLETERAANQAKGLFFSSVSHDIRTPLNAIVGFSELLEHGISDEEERARCISSIRSSGKVLARLVDDILDLSKLESGKLEVIEEPTDVPKLVREVIAACEVVRARKSLALKAEIDEMPSVSVDPQRVRQILFNLLSNAYKYTDRGTITVCVRWHDGTLALSVADTGKGISKENIERILQPFVQLADKNHRDGTGLGLPICQKLASLMGGELAIDSEVGKGSTFTVTLRGVQVAGTASGGADAADVRASQTCLGRTPSRVLIVDDSPVNRAVLKAMLDKTGVPDVAMAENGRAALEVLKNDANFDMVLSDLWMPEMDGNELVHVIRGDEQLKKLPVFLLTADVEARSQAESHGFSGILLKPITLEKLRSLFA